MILVKRSWSSPAKNAMILNSSHDLRMSAQQASNLQAAPRPRPHPDQAYALRRNPATRRSEPAIDPMDCHGRAPHHERRPTRCRVPKTIRRLRTPRRGLPDSATAGRRMITIVHPAQHRESLARRPNRHETPLCCLAVPPRHQRPRRSAMRLLLSTAPRRWRRGTLHEGRPAAAASSSPGISSAAP